MATNAAGDVRPWFTRSYRCGNEGIGVVDASRGDTSRLHHCFETARRPWPTTQAEGSEERAATFSSARLKAQQTDERVCIASDSW